MKDKDLWILAVVIGALWVMTQGGVPGVQTVAPGAVQTDGVTVYTGTPTVEWYATDAITGKEVDPGHFRVTLAGVSNELTGSDTANASIGDPYTVCLMPNSTYYGKCESGAINKSVTKINLQVYHVASSPTCYINNDPENATTRNSESTETAGSTADNITDDETMQPTLCCTGVGANQAFGPDGILYLWDWNTSTFDALYSSGGKQIDIMPKGHTIDTNSNVISSWEFSGPLLNGQTICTTMTFDGEATAMSEAEFAQSGSPSYHIYDKFLSRNSQTDVLELKYARETDGSDTNSVTNVDSWYLLTS